MGGKTYIVLFSVNPCSSASLAVVFLFALFDGTIPAATLRKKPLSLAESVVSWLLMLAGLLIILGLNVPWSQGPSCARSDEISSGLCSNGVDSRETSRASFGGRPSQFLGSLECDGLDWL